MAVKDNWGGGGRLGEEFKKKIQNHQIVSS